MPKKFVDGLLNNMKFEDSKTLPIESIYINNNKVYVSTPGTEYSFAKLKEVRAGLFLIDGVEYNLSVPGMNKYYVGKSKFYLKTTNVSHTINLIVITGKIIENIVLTDVIGCEKIREKDLAFFQAMFNSNIMYSINEVNNSKIIVNNINCNKYISNKNDRPIHTIIIKKFINLPCFQIPDSLSSTTVSILADAVIEDERKDVLLVIKHPFKKYIIDVFEYNDEVHFKVCNPKLMFKLTPLFK